MHSSIYTKQGQVLTYVVVIFAQYERNLQIRKVETRICFLSKEIVNNADMRPKGQ